MTRGNSFETRKEEFLTGENRQILIITTNRKHNRKNNCYILSN